MSELLVTWDDPARTQISRALAKGLLSLGSKVCADMTLFGEDEIFKLLERPPDSNLGDFALPGFRFAKVLKMAPTKIAAELKSFLERCESEWIAQVEVEGAFINIHIDQGVLARFLIPQVLDKSYFRMKRSPACRVKEIMVEFSQPNTHKEFHIGHARNVCLGDAMSRILSWNDFKVTPVNYIGDEGAHVAKCIWAIKRYSGAKASEKFSEWYGARYSEANAAIQKASEAEKKEIQIEMSLILKSLENKSGADYLVWQESRKECLLDFDRIYSWLGVNFSHIFYESEVSERSQDIVDEYIEKGLFTESDGAFGVSLEEYGLGYFMVRKSDGSSLYITKDLALAKLKFEEFNIDTSVYVVGSEQNFHFRQLFKVLDLMGFAQAKSCFHMSYAHVTLPEGRISSRTGNAVGFALLMKLTEQEISKHLDKYRSDDSWSKDDVDRTGHRLAKAAIKYGMLSADPQKEIVFDPESWTSFEGNSGPYLLYSYARTCSIVRAASEKNIKVSFDHLDLLVQEQESDLMRLIYDFNGVVAGAAQQYKPSMIANALFALCKAFNRFYANHSVLKASALDLAEARLSLVSAFSVTLKEGLELLGIDPVERM